MGAEEAASDWLRGRLQTGNRCGGCGDLRGRRGRLWTRNGCGELHGRLRTAWVQGIGWKWVGKSRWRSASVAARTAADGVVESPPAQMRRPTAFIFFFDGAIWLSPGHLRLTRGPAGNRTTTTSLSATQECRNTNWATRTPGAQRLLWLPWKRCQKQTHLL